MKYFDSARNQLIFAELKATPVFWDNHWNINKDIRARLLAKKNTFVSTVTRKYLKPSDGIILEGGCGNGFNIASLVNSGYKCIGVDYAAETVKSLQKFVPEIEVRFADVRQLPFENGYFSGYWSWGVIEHFQGGYGEILSEMHRVIKDGGYLFLVFPYMSILRRLKAMIGFYPLYEDKSRDDFYQFALNAQRVIRDFQARGFILKEASPIDGIKGLKNEIVLFRPVLQKLYSYCGNDIFVKFFLKCLDLSTSLFAGHSILLVFQKAVQKNGR